MMKKIPKKYWKESFDKWTQNTKYALRQSINTSSVRCGYCEHDDSYIKRDCPTCALNDVCLNGKNTALRKWRGERMGDAPRWKLVLRWSRQILQAIIDDGRKHGYVGKKEEKKIAEVMNETTL